MVHRSIFLLPSYHCWQITTVLLRAKWHFQQFVVGIYCKIEIEWLQFLRYQLSTLRVDCYQDLCEAILDGDPMNVGCKVILPSTFT